MRRDIDPYFEEARTQGMHIRYAADTHQHNDYVTGICELPERGDVQLLAGAVHVTGAKFTDRVGELPRDRPVALVCCSGYRSSVAGSVLQRHGFGQVFNVLGGMTGWEAEGLPVVRD